MLDFFEAVGEAPSLKGWSGLGLAVQGYQKRALPVLAWLIDLARRQNRRIPVRLVKGAYWDTEIKRGQEQGLVDYPVFTRKAATDTSYLACARVMLAASDAIYPQFATHNAHTLAAIDTLAGDRSDFEFQRLHGMGEALHEFYRDERKGVGTRIYAPVGSHEDLLAYLVRRLLENGANTSFVNRLADDEAPLDDIIADPVAATCQGHAAAQSAHPAAGRHAAGPQELRRFRLGRSGQERADDRRDDEIAGDAADRRSHHLGQGDQASDFHDVFDPSDRTRLIGKVAEVSEADVSNALERCLPRAGRLGCARRQQARRHPGARRRSVRGQ